MAAPSADRLSPLKALLVKAGSRLGIDLTYFVKNSAIVTFTYIASVASGLVTGYLVARMFPKEIYGSYRFVLSIIGIVSMVSIPGLASAISRSIARDGKEKTPLRFTMATNIALCVVGVLILWGAIPFLHLWDRQDLWPLFFVGGLLFIPNQVGATFLSGIVTGTEKFSVNLRTTTISSLVVIPSVLLMLWLRPSPVILMGLMVGLPALLYLLEIRRALPSFPSTEKSWKVTTYGVLLSLNTIPITLATHLDGLLISAFFGLNNLAVFAVAILIPEQVKTWCKYMLPVSYARQAAGDDRADRRAKMTRAVWIGTLIFAVGIGLYVVIAPFVLPWLFPRYLGQMQDVILWSQASAIALITTPATLFPQYLEARGMVRDLRNAQWTASITLCALLVWLIPAIGPLGALIARGVYRFIYVAYAWWALRRHPPGSRETA